MHLIDSHCHLDFTQFDHDRNAILTNCKQLGINKIIVPGVTADGWQTLIRLCQQSAMLYPALGLHPMFMAQHQYADIQRLEQAIREFRPIAVGEIGLDFYLKDHDKPSQSHLFEQQLQLAADYQLPVILHVRKAHDQTLALLKKYSLKGGIVHAFSGSYQQAEHYIKLGFLLGVGGSISYDRATRVRRLFQQLPLTSLALETDAPDMPLQNQQGRRNSPENIPVILHHLASLRSETQTQIATATSENVDKIFFGKTSRSAQ